MTDILLHIQKKEPQRNKDRHRLKRCWIHHISSNLMCILNFARLMTHFMDQLDLQVPNITLLMENIMRLIHKKIKYPTKVWLKRINCESISSRRKEKRMVLMIFLVNFKIGLTRKTNLIIWRKGKIQRDQTNRKSQSIKSILIR